MTSSRQAVPSDQELRFPHIIRVQAAAGAGKTYLIAIRFCQFMLSRIIPFGSMHNLLAITFTVEAANQMKQRILSMLKATALGKEALEDLRPILPSFRDEEALKSSAMKAVSSVLREFHHLNVRTIDSFLYRIIQTAPMELGLTQTEEIKEDEHEIMDYCLKRLIYRAGKDAGTFKIVKDAIFHCLIAEQRASWWPQGLLMELLQDFHSKECMFGAEISTKYPNMKKEILPLENAVRKRVKELLHISSGLSLKWNVARQLERIAHQKDMEDMALEDLLGSTIWMKEDCKDLFKKKSHCHLQQSLHPKWLEIRDIVSRYAEKVACFKPGSYVRVYREFRKLVKEKKRRSGVLFLGDINLLAGRLMELVPLPEILLRLGTTYYHFLFDEFQDTSLLQWKGLYPMVDEALSHGGSVFSVGDPKQLLYRWRGSDLNVNLDSLGRFPQVEGVKEIVLPYNWRSRENIIWFNTNVFSKENLEGLLKGSRPSVHPSIARDILTTYKNVQQEIPPKKKKEEVRGGYVEVCFLDERLRLSELRGLATDWLKDLLKDDILRRYRPRDCMVLLRKNGDVEYFTQALRREGIPVCSHRQLDVRNDPVVRFLIHCVGLMEDPDSSYLLHALTVNNPFERYGVGPEALREWILGLLPIARSLPPYDLMALLAQNLKVMEMFPGSQGALLHLLEIMHKEEGDQASSLKEFLEWIHAERQASFVMDIPPGLNAVRIMTIHKAKGLESPVVLLPMFAPSRNQRAGVTYQEGDGGKLIPMRTTSTLRKASKRLDELHTKEAGRILLDEINCAYVALTRAKDELYIHCPKDKNPILSCIYQMADQNRVFSLGQKRRPDILTGKEGPLEEVQATGLQFPIGQAPMPHELFGFMVRRRKEPIFLMEPRRREAIRTGELVHDLLSFIERVPCNPVREEVLDFLNELVAKHPGKALDNLGINALIDIMLHPAVQPLFFGPPSMRVWNEREIASEEGELYRVDRLVLRPDDGLYVGEYKTGKGPRQEDLKQTRKYIDLLAEMYPKGPITGLLIYIDQNEVIRIDGTDRDCRK